MHIENQNRSSDAKKDYSYKFFIFLVDYLSGKTHFSIKYF
jgi:hypothetical protein